MCLMTPKEVWDNSSLIRRVAMYSIARNERVNPYSSYGYRIAEYGWDELPDSIRHTIQQNWEYEYH